MLIDLVCICSLSRDRWRVIWKSAAHISEQDKATLNRIKSEFTQSGCLHERAGLYLEITGPKATLKFDTNCLRIPIDLLDIEILGNPAMLLTED